MALDLGTLVAKLKLQTDEFDKGLGQLPGKAEGAGRRAGAGLSRGTSGGLGGMVKMFAGLGIAKAGSDLIRFGFDTAKGMEQAQISFTTMLGSAKKANAFIGDLQQFAAKTPFTFPGLQESASKLVAMGISTEKIIPIMTTLGNVTSGMGTGEEGIKRAMVALQQMNAAGRIQAQDLNQLRDAGVPVYDLLAAATGRSKKEVAALAASGKLTSKDLAAMMKALETGKGLERFNGLMDKQSQSLEGIISSLQDTVGQGLAAALTPLIPLIKDGLAGVTAALPPIIAGIQTFGKWVADNKVVLGYLAKGLLIVGAAMIALNAIMAVNPFSLVVMAIAALVAGLLWCYDNVEWFRDGVNAAFKVIGDIAKWLWNNALAPALRGIVTGFAWVVDGLASMLEGLGQIPGFEWAKEAGKNLRGMAQGARDAANGIKNIPDAQPQVALNDQASEKVAKIDKQIKNVKDRIVKATAKGDTKQVEKLKTQLAQLKDKKVKINLSKTGLKGIKVTAMPGGSMKVSAYAAGGRFMPGWALVGEEGPELVKFSGSGRVFTAPQTRKMLAAQPPQPARAGMTLNITNVHPQAEPTSVTTNRALQVAATLGGK